ncbi:MAG: ribosome recycling factor [Candidatus Lernaella stagnicola]|nr:ribosome recycling factor [Candidatus Lernaella stagnicola]
MIDDVFDACREGMEKTIKNLGRELAKIRTGRANPAIIDGIRVDYYGTPTPLSQMATISVPESRLIVIAPWEQPKCNEIAKAIQSADLGLNPQTDGKVVRIAFPPLTEDRRKELVRVVKKMGEDHKIAVRKERRDANEMIKEAQKDGDVSEDDAHRGTDRVHKLHEDFIEKIDEMVAKREKEVMEI